jgi:hypothetical protein
MAKILQKSMALKLKGLADFAVAGGHEKKVLAGAVFPGNYPTHKLQ